MSFARYPEYKDSGVEWLGEVPEHWAVAKTVRYFKVAMGQTILREDLVDDGLWPVFSATDGDHYFGRINEPQVRLAVGDIVIPARGNSIGAVKLVKEPSTTTQTTIYCKNLSHGQLYPLFVFYFLKGCREEWPRLFEQHSPTFKWTPSRLQKVQSYPNGVTRGVPGISFYAASASFGCICWYCVSGVSRPRLECGLSLLYQSRYWAMQVRAAPTLS